MFHSNLIQSLAQMCSEHSVDKQFKNAMEVSTAPSCPSTRSVWMTLLNFGWSCVSHELGSAILAGRFQLGISHDSMILYHIAGRCCDQSVQGSWVNDVPPLVHTSASLRVLTAPFPVPSIACRDCATVSSKF